MSNFTTYHLDTLPEFFDFCRNLEYGWVDAKGRKHHGPNNSPEYHLQTPDETLQRQIGICWDQTELQRAWFTARNYETTSYLLFYQLEESWPSHSILVYREGHQYCWFEPMFNTTAIYYCGIHKYDSLEELLNHFRTKFVRNGRDSGFLPAEFEFDKLKLYAYDKPTFGITDTEFFTHCQRGTKLQLSV